MRQNWRFIFCCFLFFIFDILSAQQIQPVDSLFFRGITAYQEGDYQEALQILEFLDRIYPNHNLTTGSILIQAKSLYKLKEYRRALDVFEEIVEKYPQSKYLDDGLYGMATAYYRMNMYKEAVNRLIEVIEKGEDKRLLRKAAKLSSDIMDYCMEDEDLENLLKEVVSERGKAVVTLRLAQREIDNQRFQAAKKVLRDYLDRYPRSAYVFQVEQLLSKAEEMGKHVIKVGIILPLSGSLAEDGNRMLEGIQYAVEQYNEKEKGARIEVLVRDSGSNVLQAVRTAQELCNVEEVVAIIGELESDLTAAIAGIAQAKNVVLLAPTATEDGITSIGSFIFQLNSTLGKRGEMLAEYAVSGLGLKRFAVLAPVDSYGKAMRDAFVQTVNRLGGEILVEKWYFEGAKDLGPQFRAIRETGINQMIQDSIIVIISEEELEENPEEYPEGGDVLYVTQEVSELVDSTSLAVTSFDGIFFPVYNDDLQYVIPQFAFYNIKAKAFGGTPWNDIDILQDNRNYIDGVIFLSDYYIDPSDFNYYRFRDAYRKAWGKSAGKMEIFGFDTAAVLLKVIRDKSYTSQQIRDELANIDNFSIIRGTISIDSDRVNSSLNLLQFRGGKILQVR